MQATNNLKFGDAIRIEVESKICTESGYPELDAYEKPYNIACSSLQEVGVALRFPLKYHKHLALHSKLSQIFSLPKNR